MGGKFGLFFLIGLLTLWSFASASSLREKAFVPDEDVIDRGELELEGYDEELRAASDGTTNEVQTEPPEDITTPAPETTSEHVTTSQVETTEKVTTEAVTTQPAETTEAVTTEHITTEKVTTEDISTQGETTEGVTTEHITTAETTTQALASPTTEEVLITDPESITGSSIGPDSSTPSEGGGGETTETSSTDNISEGGNSEPTGEPVVTDTSENPVATSDKSTEPTTQEQAASSAGMETSPAAGGSSTPEVVVTTEAVTTIAPTTVDPCADVVCQNNGTCQGGDCICIDDFVGDVCDCRNSTVLCAEIGCPQESCYAGCTTAFCDCRKGTTVTWQNDGTRTCEDVDECYLEREFGIVHCPGKNTNCTNLKLDENSDPDAPGYTCDCLPGWTTNQNASVPAALVVCDQDEPNCPEVIITTDSPATTLQPDVATTIAVATTAAPEPPGFMWRVDDPCVGDGEEPGTCKESDGSFTCGCTPGNVQIPNAGPDDPKCKPGRCFDEILATDCTYSNYYENTCKPSDTESVTCSCPHPDIMVPADGEAEAFNGTSCELKQGVTSCPPSAAAICGDNLPCFFDPFRGDSNSPQTLTPHCTCKGNTVPQANGTCQEPPTTGSSCEKGDDDFCGFFGVCSFDATGKKTCVCAPGFNGTYPDCIDFDECSKCFPDQVCTNQIGVWEPKCECLPGYELTMDGKSCQAIDACDNGVGTAECAQQGKICRSTTLDPKGYRCACIPPLTLSLDGTTCENRIPAGPKHIHQVSLEVFTSAQDAAALGKETTVTYGNFEFFFSELVTKLQPDAGVSISSILPNMPTQAHPNGRVERDAAPAADVSVNITLAIITQDTVQDLADFANKLKASSYSDPVSGNEYLQGSQLTLRWQNNVVISGEKSRACDVYGTNCPDFTECAEAVDVNKVYTCECSSSLHLESLGYQENGVIRVCRDYDECADDAETCGQPIEAYRCINTYGDRECTCMFEEGYVPADTWNSTTPAPVRVLVDSPLGTENDVPVYFRLQSHPICVSACSDQAELGRECQGEGVEACNMKEQYCQCKAGYYGRYCRDKITPTIAPGDGGSSDSNTAGIVGGVLGALLGVVVIVSGVTIYKLRKKARRTQG